MPSFIVGQPDASGAMRLYSGYANLFSGTPGPVTGIQLRLAANASGSVYVGFSGNVQTTSGAIYSTNALSGQLDGIEMAAGDSLFVPKGKLISGELNIFLRHDAAASGQARLFWMPF